MNLPDTSMEGWKGALVMAVTTQTVVALLTRLVPTLAPGLTSTTGMGPSFIGYLAAASTVGSMFFYLTGAPLIRRTGSLRTLQIGMLVAAVGAGLLVSTVPLILVAGSVLIGIGYAPSTPAGSDILQRVAPKRHRTLLFSIKQAGVPLGGVLAGLILPPLALIDWRLSIAASVALVLFVTVAIQPMRAGLDRERDLSQKISVRTLLAPENLLAPIQALRLSARIPPIVFASLCLAAAQGATFAFMVTFLVIEIGLDLTSAGIMFSIVQVTSIVGRILLGGLADRLGSATATLCATTILSCLTTAAFAFVTPDWSFGSLAVLAAISGVTISSWNGLMLAEIAAIVPSGWVAQATSGTTMLVFIGYVVGPTIFSLLLDLSGSYTLAFLTISALTAFGAMVLLTIGDRSRKLKF